MEYVSLGTSDLKVSRICMGCMCLSLSKDQVRPWVLDRDESKAIIGRALDFGVNFFDTAMGYNGGDSERIVGSALKELAKRDEVVVATKFTPRTT
jgi:aryl-alcohol dehydrogenase-like predicted oxidoreductase